MKVETIVEELKDHVGDFVRTEAKEAVVVWLRDVGQPAAKDIAAVYTTALRESSESETGWSKFRDRVFLPCIIDGFLWFLGKAAETMAEKQAG